VYLYSNCDPQKRMLGYSVSSVFGKEIIKGAEINFCPFGYFLTHECSPPNEAMVDISTFGNLEYDQQVEIEMSIPYLIVETPFMGHYKNINP